MNFEEAYFNSKMHNYFKAQRMENSVSNVEYDMILNGGSLKKLRKK